MNKRGPIIVIEDDEDDQEILKQVFKNLDYRNKIIFFGDPEDALESLTTSDVEPFIVISDINMPKLNGLELRKKIYENESMRLKCILYLFITTNAEQKNVVDAYSKSVQGFFVKPRTFNELEQMIRRIVEYWQDCISPNYVK